MNAALDVVIQSYVTPSAAVGEIDSPYTCLVIGRNVRCALCQSEIHADVDGDVSARCKDITGG